MIPALSAALLHFLWQGALIAFALWIALTLLRRSAPNARYAACAAALVLMTAAPMVTIYALYESPAPVRAVAAVVFTLASAPLTSAPAPLDFRQWVVPVWAFGVAIFALRLAFAWRHIARLRRTASPADSWLWNELAPVRVAYRALMMRTSPSVSSTKQTKATRL